MKIKEPLDETDIRILQALQKERGKVGTPKLSEELGIPERTVRYRVNKMREKCILSPPKIQTYERKLGIGEQMLILQSNPATEDLLKEVLQKNDAFYYYAPTYGRYDGFVVYAMFPLVAPQMNQQIAEELQANGLVKDFYIIDLIDYCRKNADIFAFQPDSDWSWDQWSTEVSEILEKGCKIELALNPFPKTVKYDFKDIQIIKYMVENPEATLKDISTEIEELSLTQIHKRVKRLEKEGVIRGTKRVFTPFKETISVMCIFKSREHAKTILCGFNKLPFEITFAMETTAHYSVMIYMPPSEINQFFQRVSSLRRYTEEFFIQVVTKGKGKGYSHLLDAFNQETESWEMPVTDVLASIREAMQ